MFGAGVRLVVVIRVIELAAKIADITDFGDQVPRQFLLDLQVELHDVAVLEIRIEGEESAGRDWLSTIEGSSAGVGRKPCDIRRGLLENWSMVSVCIGPNGVCRCIRSDTDSLP